MSQRNELIHREIDVLDLASRGYSYKEISRVMSLSEPTIKSYMKSARIKLGAKNGCHAIAIYARSSQLYKSSSQNDMAIL